MTKLKCPHCGWEYTPTADGDYYLNVPNHSWPPLARQVCPGSAQHPRNAEADRRPLWKDSTEEYP